MKLSELEWKDHQWAHWRRVTIGQYAIWQALSSDIEPNVSGITCEKGNYDITDAKYVDDAYYENIGALELQCILNTLLETGELTHPEDNHDEPSPPNPKTL